MNAALFRHSAVHADVLAYLAEKGKGTPLRWLVEYDYEVFAEGHSIKYRIDLAGFNRKTKTVEAAVEIAVHSQAKDGGEKFLNYSLAKIPSYLWIDCKTGVCSLFRHNGVSYEAVDVQTVYPGLREVVAAAIKEEENL